MLSFNETKVINLSYEVIVFLIDYLNLSSRGEPCVLSFVKTEANWKPTGQHLYPVGGKDFYSRIYFDICPRNMHIYIYVENMNDGELFPPYL